MSGKSPSLYALHPVSKCGESNISSPLRAAIRKSVAPGFKIVMDYTALSL